MFKVMSGEKEVAAVNDKFVVSITDNELCPLYLKTTGDFRGWLKSRAIDSHRPNSRLLKRVLRLTEKDDIYTTLRFNAATIGDNFWVQADKEQLAYKDIQFTNDIFYKTALYGDSKAFDLPVSRTPELTNIGSYEKAWKLFNGNWVMLKRATAKEAFSEIFISNLGKELNMDMAYYYRFNDNSIATPCFVPDGLNFQPAAAFIPEEKEIDFKYNYDFFLSVNERIAHQYASILFLDAICMNVDRHLFNYGVLTSQKNGDIVSLAPNFDNNIALLTQNAVYNGKPISGFTNDYTDFFNGISYKFPQKAVLEKAVTTAYEKTFESFTKEEDIPVLEKLYTFIERSYDAVCSPVKHNIMPDNEDEEEQEP